MNKVVKYLLVFAGAMLICYILWYLRSIVLYIIISGFISLLGGPVVAFIRRFHIRNFRLSLNAAAGFTLLFFWLCIFVVFSVIIPQIAKQVNEMSSINVYSVIENLNEPIYKVEQFAQRYNLSDGSDFKVKAYVRDRLIGIFDVSYVSDFFTYLAGMLGDIFVAIFSISFISFFFLKEKGVFFNTALLVIPQIYIDRVTHIFSSINKFLGRYFIGIILEIILIMVMNTIGLTIVGLGFRNAAVVGLITGVLNVIPYLGPIIGATLGLLIGIATHLNYDFYTELLPLIGLMALVMLIVQIIDNVIFQPLIYSNSVKAHPLEIFLVILIAGTVAGVVGMIFAIPVYTIMRVVAKEFFNQYSFINKLTAKL